MPELPEIETIRCGIEPQICHQKIQEVIIRQPRLRWPVPAQLPRLVKHQMIKRVSRRGKYLLMHLDAGSVIVHLGMSGRLCLFPQDHPIAKHDHVDFVLDNGQCLRFTDPRRFGAILWCGDDPMSHPVLAKLGPEPLTEDFNGKMLFQCAQGRSTAIKNFIMDSHVVVGVGNIYAAESLFQAGIHPQRAANCISQSRYEKLVGSIKNVLRAAIQQGGTTLRDFVNGDNKPGYFKQELQVYGRGKLACFNCQTALLELKINQRSTVYCGECQT